MDKELRDILVHQRFHLAAQYTARYQQLLLSMSRYIIDGDPTTKGSQGIQVTVDREKDLGVIHAYIDLCAEELAVHEQVPAIVWANWQQGILEGFKKPAIQAVWCDIQNQGMYDDLRNFLEANGIVVP
jgi:hypothetical protein